MKWLVISCLLVLAGSDFVLGQAEPALQQITAENVSDLQTFATLSGGTFAWSSAGDMLALGSHQGIRLYKADDFSVPVRDIPLTPISLAFSPDGSRLAVGVGLPAHPLSLWDVSTGEKFLLRDDPPINRFNGMNDAIDVAFSPNGRYLASSHGYYYAGIVFDSNVRLWDADTGDLIKWRNWGTYSSVQFSPDSQTLVVLSENALRIWNVERYLGDALFEDITLTGEEPVRFTSDSRFMAFQGLDGPRLFDLENEVSVMLNHQCHCDMGRFMTMSPDGTLFVTEETPGAITFWNAAGEKLNSFYWRRLGYGPLIAEFSPDGRMFAIAHDGEIRIMGIPQP